MKPLTGKVALVSGATRGAGRGIARMLGEAGATVYCSGRSSRTKPNQSGHVHAGRPETIEETAEMVDSEGGRGIAVRVDHTVDEEVAALFDRIARDEQRLDILVNILTGEAVTEWKSFWELPHAAGRSFVDSWIWPHIATARHATPLMMRNKSGLIVEIIEQDRIDYHGQFYFDLMEIVLKRLAYSLGWELAPHGITALAITPGFMRTEAILEGYKVSEANWRDALENPDAQTFGWGGSETPCFVGRAIAALAADPRLAEKSGGLFSSWQLSEEYGFTDLGGVLPDRAVLEKAIADFLAANFKATPLGYEWQVVRRTS